MKIPDYHFPLPFDNYLPKSSRSVFQSIRAMMRRRAGKIFIILQDPSADFLAFSVSKEGLSITRTDLEAMSRKNLLFIVDQWQDFRISKE